jgi:multiple sugar transport system substrate-binding protein
MKRARTTFHSAFSATAAAYAAATVAGMLAVVALAGLFFGATGCGEGRGGGAAAGDASHVVLTIWQGFKFEEQTLFARQVEEFRARWEKANPGRRLTVRIQTVPYDNMVDKIKTAALARQTPDIAFVDSLKVVDLAYGRVLYPIDTLPNFGYGSIEEAGADFVPAGFEACVVDRLGERNLYGLPAQVTCLALFWNRALFRQQADRLTRAGLDPTRPPRDWDEFSAYAKALTDADKGIWGYGFTKSLWFSFPVLNQYEVNIVEKDAASGRYRATFASARGEAAIAALVRPVVVDRAEGGAWKAGGLGGDQGFLNGRYAMILMGPWFVEKFKSAGLDFGVALIPRIPDAEAARLGIANPVSSSNIGGQSAVIFAKSRYPELAYELIAHVASAESQTAWADELGQIPVRLSAFPRVQATQFPELKVFMEQIRTARRPPPLPLYGILETAFNAELDLVLQEKDTIPSALKNLDAVIEKRVLSEVNARAD